MPHNYTDWLLTWEMLYLPSLNDIRPITVNAACQDHLIVVLTRVLLPGFYTAPSPVRKKIHWGHDHPVISNISL